MNIRRRHAGTARHNPVLAAPSTDEAGGGFVGSTCLLGDFTGGCPDEGGVWE